MSRSVPLLILGAATLSMCCYRYARPREQRYDADGNLIANSGTTSYGHRSWIGRNMWWGFPGWSSGGSSYRSPSYGGSPSQPGISRGGFGSSGAAFGGASS